MTTVWKPLNGPPKISRWSHLSRNGERVMNTILKKYGLLDQSCCNSSSEPIPSITNKNTKWPMMGSRAGSSAFTPQLLSQTSSQSQHFQSINGVAIEPVSRSLTPQSNISAEPLNKNCPSNLCDRDFPENHYFRHHSFDFDDANDVLEYMPVLEKAKITGAWINQHSETGNADVRKHRQLQTRQVNILSSPCQSSSSDYFVKPAPVNYQSKRKEEFSTDECSINKRMKEHMKIRASFIEEPQSKDLKLNHNKHDCGQVILTRGAATDVSTLKRTEEEWVRDVITKAVEVVMALVYTDGSTQLDDEATGMKRKQSGSKTINNKVKGMIIRPTVSMTAFNSGKDEIFYVPLDVTNEQYSPFCKGLIESVMLGTQRKIALNAQKLIYAIIEAYECDTAAVLSWTVLDPFIIHWLLDSDNPFTSFSQLAEATIRSSKENLSKESSVVDDMKDLGNITGRLCDKLKGRQMWDIFFFIEIRLIPLLAFMETRKIKVDLEALLFFSDVLKEKLSRLELEAHRLAGHSFMLNSHPQLRLVLFEELQLDKKLVSGIHISKTSVNQQKSTSEAVLIKLNDTHPLPGVVLEHRQLQKLKSTYVDGILLCVEDGYLGTHWDQTAAATGRLSASRPNIQAIPKSAISIRNYKDTYIEGQESNDSVEIFARDVFVSHEGYSFLAADFQQIELRILAHMANDPALLKMFNSEEHEDIFKSLASQWLGKTVLDVTPQDRDQTKRVVYSVIYGVGKEKLSEYLKISTDAAKATMTSFLKKFPAVSLFTSKCEQFCQENGYTITIFKRRRMFPHINHHSAAMRAQAARQAVNFCIQGSAADICKAAMIQVEQTLAIRQELKSRLLIQIHDELLLEVPDEELKTVKGLLKETMESSESLCGHMAKLTVPIRISLQAGKKWGHLEPF